jgi:hypothetical protein
MSYGNAASAFGRFQGYAGRGFAGGGRTIFGPYTFAESWTSDDFESNQQFNNWVKPYLDQIQGAQGMSWDPPSSSLKTNAASSLDQWNQAADAGDQTAAGYVSQIDQQMHDLINRADQLSLTGSMGHRSEGTEVERYQTFKSIVTLMKQLVSSAPPKPTPNIAAVSPTAQVAIQQMQIQKFTPGAGKVTVLGQGTGAATAGGGTAGSVSPLTAPSGGPPAYYPPPATGGGWMVPAMIAGGVVVVGGLIFLLFRKKPASTGVAGYRRRKIRR